MNARSAGGPLTFLLLGALSCRDAKSPVKGEMREIVVVAPHPDDETLIAAGVIEAARARGARVAVIVVTNGDFTCERDGHVRQGETVAALASLGVDEDDVHFLGYPDGWLAELGDRPLPPIERRALDGSCAKAEGTYAERGESRHDEHTARTGTAGAYDARSLEEDLAALLARLQPRDLYVTHPLDRHPDHAATYAYVRRALEHTRRPPRIHRAIVHAGPCWPNGRSMSEPCPAVVEHDLTSPVPPLPAPLESYLPTERIPVPDPARKLAAIAAYRSQLGADPEHDWLTTFARADEPFWTETLTCTGVRCVATTAAPQRITLSPAAPDADVAPYHTHVDETGETLALTRGDHLLRKWTLPLTGRGGPHALDLTFSAPTITHTVEVTIVRDGSLLGVAVDPEAGD